MDDEGWSGDRPLTRWTQLSDGTPERVFTSVGRRTMTRHDPMLFALVYCRNLITDDSGHVSFAELHLALCRYVQKWKEPIDADRKSVGEGKSVSVSVDLGCRRFIKNKNKQRYRYQTIKT